MTIGDTPPLGPLETVVVMAKFPDADHEPFGAPFIERQVFGGLGTFISECSYGRASLKNVRILGWVMMPHSHQWYKDNNPASGATYFQSADGYWYGTPPDAIFDDVQTIMQRARVPLWEQRLAVIFYTGWGPTMAFSNGFGVIFSSAEFLRSSRPLINALRHESGHALGRLVHAGTLHEKNGPGEIPPSLDDIGDGGFWLTGYGDMYDAMGDGTGQYCGYHKMRCAWVDAHKSRTVTEGTVALADLDGPYPVTAALEIKVPLDVKGHAYLLERRAGVGVLVRLLLPPGQIYQGALLKNVDTALLRFGRPLERGVPFVDTYRGVSMKVSVEFGRYSFVKVTRA